MFCLKYCILEYVNDFLYIIIKYTNLILIKYYELSSHTLSDKLFKCVEMCDNNDLDQATCQCFVFIIITMVMMSRFDWKIMNFPQKFSSMSISSHSF